MRRKRKLAIRSTSRCYQVFRYYLSILASCESKEKPNSRTWGIGNPFGQSSMESLSFTTAACLVVFQGPRTPLKPQVTTAPWIWSSSMMHWSEVEKRRNNMIPSYLQHPAIATKCSNFCHEPGPLASLAPHHSPHARHGLADWSGRQRCFGCIFLSAVTMLSLKLWWSL